MENSLGVFLALTLLSSIFSLFILYNIFGKISFVESITKQNFSVKILNNKDNIKPLSFILLALMPLFNLAYTIMVLVTVEKGLLFTLISVSVLTIIITVILCAIYVFIPSYEDEIMYSSLTRLFIFAPILFLLLPILYIVAILHTIYNYRLITEEGLEYNLLMLPFKDIEDIVYNAYRNNNEKAIQELNEIAKKLISHFKLFSLDSELGIKNNENLNQVFYLDFSKPVDYTFNPEQLLILFERSKYLENNYVKDSFLELSSFGLIDTYEYMLSTRIEPMQESNKTLENYSKLEKLISEFKKDNLDLIIRKELYEIQSNTIKSFKDLLQFESKFEKEHKAKFETIKEILPEKVSVDIFSKLIQDLLNSKGFKEIIELSEGDTLDKLISESDFQVSDIYEVFAQTRILNSAIAVYYNDILPENLFGMEFIKFVDSKY